jgi:hypothetical protein
MLRPVAAMAVALGSLCLVIGGSVAYAGTARPVKITPNGVGAIALGESYYQLRAERLVGRVGRCSAGNPDQVGDRVATLTPPLNGSVHFGCTDTGDPVLNTFKVSAIEITGGASAQGVGVGATLAQIKRVFPKEHVDHTNDVRGFTVVGVLLKRNGVPSISFAVSTTNHRVTQIGIPYLVLSG